MWGTALLGTAWGYWGWGWGYPYYGWGFGRGLGFGLGYGLASGVLGGYPYYGYGGYGYPSYGYGYSYPYYGIGYGGYGLGGYYSPYYTSSIYYSYPYYGCSLSTGIGAPAITLNGWAATTFTGPAPQIQTVPGDGTFPYDGGPQSPVPLPGAQPAPSAPAITSYSR